MRLIFILTLLLPSISFSQVSADSLVAFAKTQLGVKYKYTGISPKTGFDCSGFVKYVFNHFQVDVPRASMDYEKKGRTISLDSAQTGDIIVFTGTNAAKRKPGHVGIITKKENGEVFFIHSSSGKPHGGVIITNYNTSSNYKKRYIKTVRLNEDIQG